MYVIRSCPQTTGLGEVWYLFLSPVTDARAHREDSRHETPGHVSSSSIIGNRTVPAARILAETRAPSSPPRRDTHQVHSTCELGAQQQQLGWKVGSAEPTATGTVTFFSRHMRPRATRHGIVTESYHAKTTGDPTSECLLSHKPAHDHRSIRRWSVWNNVISGTVAGHDTH